MTTKRPRDVNSLAKQIVDEATGEADPQHEPPSKDPEAVKRGKARADSLSAEQRSRIAREAARARWRSKA